MDTSTTDVRQLMTASSPGMDPIPGSASPSRAAAVATSLLRYSVLMVQLAAVLYVGARWYQLQGIAFQKLALVTLGGFSVYYFLPARLRLPFFALLSVGGILFIFGLRQGGWLIGIGLVLLALAHLPLALRYRVGLLVLAVAALGFLRSGGLRVPWSAAVWPVLGSMFMMRLIIYLYDLKHHKAPASFWHGLSYFFMLPNICFPLFPVVDYETFCRTHHDDPRAHRIYQSGIHWMVRGVVHLILYRLVYQHLPIEATDVVSVERLLRYLLWPFLLYLQVSGLFHLVIGMLHLFGFNLPETHHLFYLAPSFTDFWRRINIYWKDFMMKVFYYPAFFQLRRLGHTRALVLGTFWVFFATWCLHSYQWFWIRGSFLLKWSDVLFWTILAVLVAVNVVRESKRPMRRRLGAAAIPWRESAATGLRALGVFATICVLWSLWISDSVPDWLSLFGVLGSATVADLRLVPVLLAGAAGFVLVSIFYQRRENRPFGPWRSALQSAVTIALLLVVGAPSLYGRLEPPYAGAMKGLKSSALNDRDKARRQRDYYEKLSDVGWDNPELWKVYLERPADWGPIRHRPELSRITGGLPYLVLLPEAQGRHRGTMVQLNRWGMRDRDYPRAHPADTYRIALVGASHTFGSGVAREEGFESLVEERLNREQGLGPYARAEILNFAVEGYTALDVLADLEQRVLGFAPEALFYVAHPLDARFAVERLSGLLGSGAPLPYPFLGEFAERAGVHGPVPEADAVRILAPRAEELLAEAYREIVQRCRERGLEPVLVFLPILSRHDYDLDPAVLLHRGAEAGFVTVDLRGVYDGRDPESLHLAPWDDHPNVEGHRLVAERLYKEIRKSEGALWGAARTTIGQQPEGAHGNGPDQGQSAVIHPEGVPSR